jgi:hypothetical protein
VVKNSFIQGRVSNKETAFELVDSHLIVNDTIIQENIGLPPGGSTLRLEKSELHATGLRFLKNKGYQGGCLRNEKGSITYLEKCEFIGNEAYQFGVAYNSLSYLNIKKSMIKENKARS